jgi:hypothetical protein
MDMHGPPDDAIGRLGVHHLEQAVDDLVAADAGPAWPVPIAA